MGPYSNSRLSSFENCPKQFEFRYVQKIETDAESVEAFMGKRVHEILERLYHHVRRHDRPPSLRQVLDRFRKDWTLHWHEAVEFIKSGFIAEDYQERGDRCLENYYRSFYPFDKGETVAIEEMVEFPLDAEGRYQARGIVDRISRAAPGEYEIHDYKTGAWLPPQKRLDKDRQLALYQIGLQRSYPDAESVELVWHYLTHNKTLRSRRTSEDLEALKDKTIALIDTIESTTTYETKPGPLCPWCEYRTLCPDAKLPSPEEEPPFPGDEIATAAPPWQSRSDSVSGLAAGAPPSSGAQRPSVRAPAPSVPSPPRPVPPGGEQLELI